MGGTFVQLNYPGAYDTQISDINNLGQITGTQATDPADGRAFFGAGGSFTSFDYPGALFTYGQGINDAGTIVGKHRVQISVGPNSVQDFDHGLLIDGATLTPFDFPGATHTIGYGINNSNQIVGSYYDGAYHGYVKDGDLFTSFDVPGAVATHALGINDLGHIVGLYYDRQNKAYAFLRSGDSFTSFDFPSLTGTDLTIFSGINNVGHIVGYAYPSPPTSVPEPSPFFILALGALAVIGRRCLQITRPNRRLPGTFE